MDSKRLRQIEDIYHEACGIAEEGRESYLAEACGGDDGLRREVESLLRFDETPSGFIDNTPGSLAADMFAGRKEKLSFANKTIGHYKVIRLIGAGGMGEVYLAEDTKLGRKVALKILPSEFAEDTTRMSRFVREAKSASALNHPNIITIYEINEIGGTHFIATEFIDGKTLNDYTKDNTLNLGAMVDIAVQIASALDEAHLAGLVHRDVKPENVMIRKNGIVKVLDFGLAKASALTQHSGELSVDATEVQFQTQPGLIIGTPHYMSPEQARGKQLDHQTDIFSFGAVLYEMFSRRQPFRGETVSDIIAALLTKNPPRLKNLPPEIEGIVFKAMKKAKSDRYQSAKDLLDDLKKVQKLLNLDDDIGARIGVSSDHTATQIFDNRTTGEESSLHIPAPISSPNNLSSELSPIIGRKDELAAIKEMIRQSATRLLTLTGVGGTGKTTLARALAQESLTEFSDGVFFVELGAIADHELVEQVIAQTLGVKETSERSLIDCLKEFLHERKILLVLDNFEQITKASAKISELLTASPNLKIVVTSRVKLNLRFEYEYTLGPLQIPADDKLSAKELSEYSAIALFVQRAKAVKADFVLNDGNCESVAAVCRRLDGLPLAIELAAVQVKMLAPKAIQKRLETDLHILASGASDLPERQRTMLGAIAWSYDLLEEDEKQLFDRVYVFRGGFTLDSAEMVCNADGVLDVFNCVSALVDKSLLVQREQFDGEPRLKMLQVVREFAREKLTQRNEENEIRRRHAEYFADLAQKAEIGFRGEKSSEWLETIEIEHDNYRAALEWTLLHESETALRITGALPEFWFRRGHLAEGNKWARRAIDAGGDSADPKIRARALIGIGGLTWRQGDLIEAEKFYLGAVKLSREIPDGVLIATSLSGLGTVNMLQGHNAEAQSFLEESFKISNEVNDKYLAARLANVLGELFRSKEDYPTAKSYYEKALTISRQESFKHVIQLACVNLSAVACSMEDYKTSREYALESIKLAKESGDTVGIGFAMERFMALAVIEGEPEKAARIYGGLENIYESAGFMVEAVDQAFLDSYLDQVRAAIGNENFLLAKTEGRAMSVESAVMLAVESTSSEIGRMRRATDEAGSGFGGHSTGDAPKAATTILSTDERPVSTGPSGRFSSYLQGKAFVFVVSMFVVLATGGFFAYRYFTADTQIRSIAVMPFINESGNPEVEYLSDGMTETLINSLSKVPNLSVKARSSVFRYKGKELDPQKIASELNVEAILTGRVAQRGDQLTLNLELIDARTETVLWGDRYERKSSGIVSLQSEIARDVSSKLKAKLSGPDEVKIAKSYTANPEAYQLYLQGLYHWNKRTPEDLRRSIDALSTGNGKRSGIRPGLCLAGAGIQRSECQYRFDTSGTRRDLAERACRVAAGGRSWTTRWQKRMSCWPGLKKISNGILQPLRLSISGRLN